MVDLFTASLSLLILLSVSGLNGGLSSTMSHSAPAWTEGGSVGAVACESGGNVWREAYYPRLSTRSALRSCGICDGDAESKPQEVLRSKETRPQPQRHSELSPRDGHGGEHACHSPLDEIVRVVAGMRGGELKPNRDESCCLDPDTAVKGGGTQANATEGASPSPPLWRAAGRSRGPRSLNSLSYGTAFGDEPTMASGTGSRGGGRSPTTKAEDTTVTQFVSECLLPTARGRFRLRAYRHEGNGRSFEPVVMVSGDLSGCEGVPVRVHDQCLTSEVLGSLRCDCKQQLELAMDYISEHGGCVIYMQQEGRGIGLANKVAAYDLQDGGLDTVDANRHLGFDDDLRSYEAVEYILADMGIKSVKLMTNNPFKLKCLKAMGISILSRIPMLVAPNAHSLAYLKAKARRMSHLLHQLDDVEIMGEPPLDGATPVALPLDEVGAIRGGEHRAEGGAEAEDEEEEEGYAFGKDSVLAAIEAVREGKCVVVTDDEGRENEGDLVFAAEKSTEDLLAFTIRHTSGVICASLEEHRLEELRLPQMVLDNEDPKGTAFTITVDSKVGTSTGISAGDRAITLRALADPKANPQDFNRPGHIFPLRYTAGGVLERGGHTEAAVDLAKLAGLAPVGVLCEITTKDGKSMARVPELREFCAEHGLVLTSIQDLRCLIREMRRAETLGGTDPASSSFALAR